MAREGTRYSLEATAEVGDYVRHQVLIAGAASLTPIAAALLPHAGDRLWVGILAGATALVVEWAILARNLKLVAATDRRFVPSPFHAILLVLLAISGEAVILACSGLPLAVCAPALFMPACLQMLIGDRLFAGVTAAFSLTVMTVLGVIVDVPLGSVLAFVVLFGGGWLALLASVRAVGRLTTAGIEGSEVFAQLADVAATAEVRDEGLAQLLVLAGRLMASDRIDVIRAEPGKLPVVVATWTSPQLDEPLGLDIATVEAVVATGEACVGTGGAVAPIPTGEHDRLFLVVARAGQVRRAPETFAYRIDRVCLQVAVLIDRLRMIEQLQQLSVTDELTALPNRRALNARLNEELARSRRSSAPLTAVMIDLDHFKQYNESFGPLAGDSVLVQVADLLQARLRVTDFVGRFGGEEFIVLLPDTTVAAAWQLLEQLHDRMSGLDALRPLSFSAGITQWDNLERPDQLLARADAALYDAKAAGRSRSCVRSSVDDAHRFIVDRNTIAENSEAVAG